MYTTIRRNSLAKIRAILTKAVLLKGHVYDDMTGGESARVTVDQIMAKADSFDRVYTDEVGRLHIHLCGSNYFDAYPSIEAAKKSLTPEAFAKYFPAEGTEPLRQALETRIERTKVRACNAMDTIAAARELRQLAHLQAQRLALHFPSRHKAVDALGNIAANDD